MSRKRPIQSPKSGWSAPSKNDVYSMSVSLMRDLSTLQVDRLASLWSASQAAVQSVNEDLVAKCQAVAGLEGHLGQAREALAVREREAKQHRSAVAALEVCSADSTAFPSLL